MKIIINILLMVFFSAHTIFAQQEYILRGDVIDDKGQEVTDIRLYINGHTTRIVQGFGFQVSLIEGQVPTEVSIQSSTRKLISWDYDKENNELEVIVTRLAHVIKGQIMDYKGDPYRNAKIQVSGDANFVNSDAYGMFEMKLPPNLEITPNTIITVNDTVVIPQANLEIQKNGEIVYIQVPKYEYIPPKIDAPKETTHKIRVIDEDYEPVPFATVVLVENEYIMDEHGSIKLKANQADIRKFYVHGHDITQLSRQANNYIITAKKIKEDSVALPAVKKINEDSIPVTSSLKYIVDKLEIENHQLIRSSAMVQARIEKLNRRLLDNSVPVDEKKHIQSKLVELSHQLISNEQAYSQNLQKTQGLVVKMEKTVLQKDSLNSLVQQTLDKFEATKRDQFRERIFFLIFGILLTILAIVFYIFGRRNHKQNKEITKQKEKIVQQNMSLEKTLINLQKTQTQLVQSEKTATLGILTASVAHEINNPINYVSGGVQNLKTIYSEMWEVLDKYAELETEENTDKIQTLKNEIKELKEELEFGDSKEITETTLEDITYGTQRIIKVVKSLQTFIRLDENDMKPLDIHENLEAVLVFLGNRFMGKIKLEKEFAENLSPALCFPAKMNQALLNLLFNAEESLNGEGKISIKTSENEQFVIISIQDTGVGIPTENQANIFQPMFSTRKTGNPAGLGLTITKEIIDEHKGKIEFESEVGEGTIFRIFLPKK